MRKPLFTGSGVAIVTPFTKDTVDLHTLGKLLDFQLESGTDAIIVCGTTGEATTMTYRERMRAIEFCVEHVDGQVPVIAGSGSNSTETAIVLSRDAQRVGADGLLVVTPYYNKATQNGLYKHFKAVADSVKVPCILYNVPSRTGCNIAPETAVRLCTDVENIVGIKEASGNISQIVKLMSMADGKVDLYSGNDDQIVPLLALGGKGVISVLSNVAPRQTHDICAKFFAGDVAGSAAEQFRAIPLCNALFCEVNPIPVKMALNLMGKEVGSLRAPLTDMEPENVTKLEKAMKEYGIL